MNFLLLGGILIATSAGILVWQLSLPWLLAYLAGVNLTTILLYGYDKLAARARYSRVPEKTLHIFAFAGGTPGAFLAQGLFRHKTSKSSFRTAFWILAGIQAAIIIWAIWYF